MSEIVAMFAIAAVLGVYSTHKWLTSSDNEYEAFNRAVKELRQDVTDLERVDNDYEQRFNSLGAKIYDVNAKTDKLQSELLQKKPTVQKLMITQAIPIQVIKTPPIKALKQSLRK